VRILCYECCFLRGYNPRIVAHLNLQTIRGVNNFWRQPLERHSCSPYCSPDDGADAVGAVGRTVRRASQYPAQPSTKSGEWPMYNRRSARQQVLRRWIRSMAGNFDKLEVPHFKTTTWAAS